MQGLVSILEKVTNPESFRIIALMLISAVIYLLITGFNYLSDRIDKLETETNKKIEVIQADVIPRNEFRQMERRLDTYFVQLDKRLERIENTIVK